MPAPKLTHEQTQAVMAWHAAGMGRRAIARRLVADGVQISDRAVGLIIARTHPGPCASAPTSTERAADVRVLGELLATLRKLFGEDCSTLERVRLSAEIRAVLADRRTARLMSDMRAADVATQADAEAVMRKIDRLAAAMASPPTTNEVH